MKDHRPQRVQVRRRKCQVMPGGFEMIEVLRMGTMSQYRCPAEIEVIVVNLIQAQRAVSPLGPNAIRIA
jgi:phosphoribosylformylglycinamidine (FGAM) synthase-like amidotransferase family enzyme